MASWWPVRINLPKERNSLKWRSKFKTGLVAGVGLAVMFKCVTIRFCWFAADGFGEFVYHHRIIAVFFLFLFVRKWFLGRLGSVFWFDWGIRGSFSCNTYAIVQALLVGECASIDLSLKLGRQPNFGLIFVLGNVWKRILTLTLSQFIGTLILFIIKNDFLRYKK